MKKAIVILVAVIISSAGLTAQDVKPAVKAGALSLNFTFAGFGAFGIGPSGINGGVGVSYFLSNDAAVRLGLQVISNSQSTPWNDLTQGGTNPGTDGTSSNFGVGIGADYLMYWRAITPRVKPFIGLGVSFSMNSSDVKPALPNGAAGGTLTETKNGAGNDGMTLGVAGILGGEFFIYPEISLSAEYRLNLFSLTSRSDRVLSYQGGTSVTTKQGSATQILGFGAAGATLHIFF